MATALGQAFEDAVHAKLPSATQDVRTVILETPRIDTPRKCAEEMDMIIRFLFGENSELSDPDINYAPILRVKIETILKYFQNLQLNQIHQVYSQFYSADGKDMSDIIGVQTQNILKLKEDVESLLDLVFAPFHLVKTENTHGSSREISLLKSIWYSPHKRLYTSHRDELDLKRPVTGFLTKLRPDTSSEDVRSIKSKNVVSILEGKTRNISSRKPPISNKSHPTHQMQKISSDEIEPIEEVIQEINRGLSIQEEDLMKYLKEELSNLKEFLIQSVPFFQRLQKFFSLDRELHQLTLRIEKFEKTEAQKNKKHKISPIELITQLLNLESQSQKTSTTQRKIARLRNRIKKLEQQNGNKYEVTLQSELIERRDQILAELQSLEIHRAPTHQEFINGTLLSLGFQEQSYSVHGKVITAGIFGENFIDVFIDILNQIDEPTGEIISLGDVVKSFQDLEFGSNPFHDKMCESDIDDFFEYFPEFITGCAQKSRNIIIPEEIPSLTSKKIEESYKELAPVLSDELGDDGKEERMLVGLKNQIDTLEKRIRRYMDYWIKKREQVANNIFAVSGALNALQNDQVIPKRFAGLNQESLMIRYNELSWEMDTLRYIPSGAFIVGESDEYNRLQEELKRLMKRYQRLKRVSTK